MENGWTSASRPTRRIPASAAVALLLCACPGRDGSQQGATWSPRIPASGLSAVETAADLPTHVTLAPDAALIDGALDAPTGLDLGFGRSLAGDRAYRDLGARLADPTAPVDLLYVTLDRPLPADVAAAYTWSAFSSDDDVTWTGVPITGTPAFEAAEKRFAIPIVRTQAPYLKVVTRPLDAGVTTDPALAAVFVTELTLDAFP